jgi:hypothetical protein
VIAAFLVIETRVEAPLMPLRIFRNKTLAGANAVGVLLGGSFLARYGAGFLLPATRADYGCLLRDRHFAREPVNRAGSRQGA